MATGTETPERARPSKDDARVLAEALGLPSARAAGLFDDHLTSFLLPAGACLFSEGEAPEAVYVVTHGRLRVHAAGSTLAEIGRGEVIGERAFLAGEPRAASVHALRESRLLRIDHEAFVRLVTTNAEVALHLAAVALKHVSAPARRSTPPTCLTLVPITGRVDVDGLADQLAAEWDEAKIVRAKDIDQSLSPTELLDHLARLEEHHERILFVAEPDDTAWTLRTIRASDSIVLVAHATQAPAPRQLEREIWNALAAEHGPQPILLLVQRPRTEVPRGTRAWLDVRPVRTHLHLREGDDASLKRCARLLAGKANALVFGGGGARGFAHLGIVETLENLNHPIDMVGGTSIGSVMSAGVALGYAPDERRRIGRLAFHKVIDYTLPVVSTLAGGKVTARTVEILGDMDIADFWIPFYCVSANLTTGREEIHDRGSAALALRASISIPGVFPPVARDGDLLVDGGTVDNLPIAEMRRRNPTGHIIAIDVTPGGGPRARAEYSPAIRGFQALVARRRGAGPPTLLTTMTRATMIASSQAKDRAISDQLADLLIDIEVQGVGMLDFSKGDAIADNAAARSQPVLAALLANGAHGHVLIER